MGWPAWTHASNRQVPPPVSAGLPVGEGSPQGVPGPPIRLGDPTDPVPCRPRPFPAGRPQQAGAWCPVLPCALCKVRGGGRGHWLGCEREVLTLPCSSAPSAQLQRWRQGQGATDQHPRPPRRTCCRWPRTLVLQSKTPLPSEEYRLYRNSVV